MARRKSHVIESRESYWRGVVLAWRASGQTQAAFCRERSISATALCWWKRELARRDGRVARQRRGAGPARFVPVQVIPGAANTSTMVEVVLCNGRVLRVPATIEAERVAQLAHAVEGASC